MSTQPGLDPVALERFRQLLLELKRGGVPGAKVLKVS